MTENALFSDAEMGTPAAGYRVLARKYRPRNFDELIGQEALVRTLRNAIQGGRVAHAFMLTGVRGVGKTTTARIIAKALNYTGPDGKAGPSVGPTDDCETCRAIAEDRHPDVIEMDAASKRGIDDIRQVIDGVRYAPSSARYKIYIIDEVHMLTDAAFNALLKTLEEPPPHVKFIFATTEIRKVPVTVLSRCQRFDLRRVDVPTLAAHYKNVCRLEKVEADDAAIDMIARAADGSVRDGLSLLDQAIALADGRVVESQVNEMLGLADRGRVLDLLEHAIRGDSARSLNIMEDLYRGGADPMTVLQDMLDLTHVMTKLRAVPAMKASLSGSIAPDSLNRAAVLAAELSMPTLGRAWQILLKGINEAGQAAHPQSAAEMILIRLSYAANLPDPADLIRRLKNGEDFGAGARTSADTDGSRPQPGTLNQSPSPSSLRAVGGTGGGVAVAQAVDVPATARALSTLADIELLLQDSGHALLAAEFYHHVGLVRLEPGKLEIFTERTNLVNDLQKALSVATNMRWLVILSHKPGQPSLAAQRAQQEKLILDDMRKHPVVESALKIFPGAVLSVKNPKAK